MTESSLINTVLMLPDIRRIGEVSVDDKRASLEALLPSVIDDILLSFDWSFAINEYDESIVADQAEYTIKGEDDCRDIINVRYGTTTSLSLLDKRRQVDVDEWLTGRTYTDIGIWIPYGYNLGYPQIKIIATPTDATKILRIRYRRKNVSLSEFPDEFATVFQSGLAKRMIPAYDVVYTKDMGRLIDAYSQGGGEDDPVKQDKRVVTGNNRRASLMGWS